MSIFLCPICHSPLTRGEKAYTCPNRHSYDIAAAGYTHLLPANKKNSLQPGDDKDMVASRAAFLSKGYYAPLRQALCELSLNLGGKSLTVFDSGCGEGYYTAGIYEALCSGGRNVHMAGIDISKFAVQRAARKVREGEFAVASAYHLPVADSSCDLLINCFSPLALSEFHRVLKQGGHFFYVVPGAKHLWEMKEILYPTPYPNEEKLTPYEGFSYIEVRRVEDTVTLTSQEDIFALFQMTPYYWKTPKDGVERLKTLSTLTTAIDFDIHVFRKD